MTSGPRSETGHRAGEFEALRNKRATLTTKSVGGPILPTCNDIESLLPWYLNRTLDESETGLVSAHLPVCEACRRALDETREAAFVFAAHAAPTVLAGAILEPTSVASAEHSMLEEHLSYCQTCALESEIVRDSDRVERRAPARSVAWAVAAGFAAAVVGVSLLAPAEQPEPQRLQVAAASEVVFADGFEDGELANWKVLGRSIPGKVEGQGRGH